MSSHTRRVFCASSLGIPWLFLAGLPRNGLYAYPNQDGTSDKQGTDLRQFLKELEASGVIGRNDAVAERNMEEVLRVRSEAAQALLDGNIERAIAVYMDPLPQLFNGAFFLLYKNVLREGVEAELQRFRILEAANEFGPLCVCCDKGEAGKLVLAGITKTSKEVRQKVKELNEETIVATQAWVEVWVRGKDSAWKVGFSISSVAESA